MWNVTGQRRETVHVGIAKGQRACVLIYTQMRKRERERRRYVGGGEGGEREERVRGEGEVDRCI